MTNALIHLNDEAGVDYFSVEMENDVGNWLDSFMTLEEALEYIISHGLIYDQATGFRDSRYKSHHF